MFPFIHLADTGGGNALNVQRTIKDLIAAGAAGCFLEAWHLTGRKHSNFKMCIYIYSKTLIFVFMLFQDQAWPKKCGKSSAWDSFCLGWQNTFYILGSIAWNLLFVFYVSSSRTHARETGLLDPSLFHNPYCSFSLFSFFIYYVYNTIVNMLGLLILFPELVFCCSLLCHRACELFLCSLTSLLGYTCRGTCCKNSICKRCYWWFWLFSCGKDWCTCNISKIWSLRSHFSC